MVEGDCYQDGKKKSWTGASFMPEIKMADTVTSIETGIFTSLFVGLVIDILTLTYCLYILRLWDLLKCLS